MSSNPNELTSMVDADGTTAYTYDVWGRTISKTRGGYAAAYSWRFGDKLKKYDTNFPGEAEAAYNYDGLGKRRLKLMNPDGAYTEADATWYRYGAGWDAIGEYASTDVDDWVIGAAERTYVGKSAYIDGATPSSGTYAYLTHDHLGSVRGGWNASKARVASSEFMAYGDTRVESGLRMDLGYTSHKWDAESKQYYAPYRYYSTGTGRWMSRDPLGFVDGPNMYGYVGGMPTMAVDPLGKQSIAGTLTGTAVAPGVGTLVGGVVDACIFVASAAIAAVAITTLIENAGDETVPPLVFPENPDDLDKILGPHEAIPDIPGPPESGGTPGRNKKRWKYGDDNITHENHNYDKSGNPKHDNPHYHHNYGPKGKGHDHFLPGDRIPPQSCTQ